MSGDLTARLTHRGREWIAGWEFDAYRGRHVFGVKPALGSDGIPLREFQLALAAAKKLPLHQLRPFQ